MNQRLQHDIAFATARNILEIFMNMLRDDEKHEAFGMIYERVKAALVDYDQRTKSVLHRLKPLQN